MTIILLHLGPLLCNSSVLEKNVIVNCVESDGRTPDRLSTQCVINDDPSLNCEIGNSMLCMVSLLVTIGTFPYEISLRTLSSGPHVISVFQLGVTTNISEFAGGTQFFLPRKFCCIR